MSSPVSPVGFYGIYGLYKVTIDILICDRLKSKFADVINYSSFWPSSSSQWLDSMPINRCTVCVWYGYNRNPYPYRPNLPLVQLMAIICTAIPVYGYGGQS